MTSGNFIFSIQFVLGFLISCELHASAWQIIDQGLFVGHFESPQKSIHGDSKITVLKIDPEFYDINLYSASENGQSNLSIREWAQKYDLTAAINAGMYQTDYTSNVGYMKNFNHVNSPGVNHYLSAAAFNPKSESDPPFRIFDLDEIEMDEIKPKYNTIIQNLRLVKRPRENRWPQQEKIWSEAALGEDIDGNILFIFSRSPYSMHDFNNILLNLPIELQCAQHLEGGPPASIYLNTKNHKLEYVGSYETNFFEDDENLLLWDIPNVIGITKTED